MRTPRFFYHFVLLPLVLKPLLLFNAAQFRLRGGGFDGLDRLFDGDGSSFVKIATGELPSFGFRIELVDQFLESGNRAFSC